MTAFARAEGETQWGAALWELRSVNNRYLDVSPRIPDDLRAIEQEVRERVRRRLGRGKVDCSLRLTRSSEVATGFTVDTALAQRIADASREIDHILHDPARVGSMEVLRWPGVIQSAAIDHEAIGKAALALLDTALDDLVATREREGGRIAALLEERLAAIQSIVAAVRGRIPEVVAAARQRLVARLAELREQLDPERIEQEIAILAQKSDAAEELDRIEAHVAEVRGILARDEPAGRRLDFMMQEFNREANTLGSKSADPDTTRAAVDLKVLIEQMREQVQNLE